MNNDDKDRDTTKVTVYDAEALDKMEGWTGDVTDPLYAIVSTGGWNYAWVFEYAIENLDADINRVKQIGPDEFQLGKGVFTKAEIDELHRIPDALSMALYEDTGKMLERRSEDIRYERPKRPDGHQVTPRARRSPRRPERRTRRGREARASVAARTGEVIPSKRWEHKTTGRTASIYGAVPWTGGRGDREEDWEMKTVGWTIRWSDGTTGIGRQPFKSRREAQDWLDKYDARMRRR